MKKTMKSLPFKWMAIRPILISKALLMLVSMLPVLLPAQVFNSPEGDLSVQVTGETVYLSQSMAERNCGSNYDMHVYLAGDILYWYQVDHGSSAWCTCNFNLSVTVESIPSGHYTAKVFYTECPDCPSPGPDTVYVGEVEFDIVTTNPNSSVSIINQYQSDCLQYTSTKDDKVEKLPFSVFPNPARELVTIKISKQTVGSGFVLVDKIGKKALSGTLTHESNELDISQIDPGVYFLIIDDNQSVLTNKIVVQ